MAPAEANEPQLSSSLGALAQMESSLLESIPGHKVVWLGFSQGACLACEYVARTAIPRGGLAALTGARIGPAGTDLAIAGDLGGMPVWISAGAGDPWIDLGRMQQSAAAFESAGASVSTRLFDDSEHRIRSAEVAAVRSMLNERVLHG